MAKKIWGGRFKNITNKKVEEFSSSIDTDKNLYAFDIQGSIAHVEMLSKQKIVSVSDKRKIVKSLTQIRKQIEKGRFEFAVELEDIHMNIEQAVTKRIGNAGKKVHTARSRNDQVATDVKLYIKDSIGDLRKDLIVLEKNIVKNAEKNLSLAIPFYTHLQSAQPVLVSHYLLAFFEMFLRDIDRIDSAVYRLDENP